MYKQPNLINKGSLQNNIFVNMSIGSLNNNIFVILRQAVMNWQWW